MCPYNEALYADLSFLLLRKLGTREEEVLFFEEVASMFELLKLQKQIEATTKATQNDSKVRVN